MKFLSVVIVTWNCRKYTAECLDSLAAYAQDPQVEIIVVDNASSDGTPEMVRDAYPGVVLIQSQVNLGFARGNNVGLLRSTGEYICLINPDVRVFEGCIEKMLAYMRENPKVGLLGPRMLGRDGKSYRSCMGAPTLWRLFCRALALDVLFPRSRLFGGFLMPYFKRDQITEVDILNGWFWMTRREALNEVGPLDENLFMYGDDLDWLKRFHEAGWKVVYFPMAESLHYGGASSANAPIRFSVEMQKTFFQYWRKNYGHFSQFVYLMILWINQTLRPAGNVVLFVGSKSKRAEAAFKVKRSLACMRWIMGEKPQGETDKISTTESYL